MSFPVPADSRLPDMMLKIKPLYLNYSAVLLCVVACTVFFYRAHVPSQSGVLYDFDARYWYVAGKCWLAGQSPYDTDAFSATWTRELGDHTRPTYDTAFVYPPTMLLLGIPMACLSWDAARLALRLISCLAFFGSCFFSMGIVADCLERGWKCRELWFWAGCCGLLFSVSQALYQGQNSLIVLCGMTAMLYAWKRNSEGLFLLGFLLASIKPQITVLVMLYVLARGGIAPVCRAAAAVGLISLALVAVVPHESIVPHVAESVRIHMQQQVFNQFNHYDTLPGLLGGTSAGPGVFVGGILAGCMIVVGLALLLRHRATDRLQVADVAGLQFVYALSVAVLPLHRYDTVLYVPLLISLPVVMGPGRRLLLGGTVLLHGCVWMGGLLKLGARCVLQLPPERIGLFVQQHYWDIASDSAAIMAGVVLMIVTLSVLRAMRWTAPDCTGG